MTADLEFVLKGEPTNAKDNSFDAVTGHTILDAYKLDSTWLWRIDFDGNIRSGEHCTQVHSGTTAVTAAPSW
ncbi:rhamnogalacturonan lyase family protein [Streptomyces sp. NPDC002143]